eukprot:3879141-Rhodomonas_salina.3
MTSVAEAEKQGGSSGDGDVLPALCAAAQVRRVEAHGLRDDEPGQVAPSIKHSLNTTNLQHPLRLLPGRGSVRPGSSRDWLGSAWRGRSALTAGESATWCWEPWARGCATAATGASRRDVLMMPLTCACATDCSKWSVSLGAETLTRAQVRAAEHAGVPGHSHGAAGPAHPHGVGQSHRASQ